MKQNDLEVSGRVHSIESFGAVDGPGIRLVVFCQGCPLRCAYCHNPDTWDMSAGNMMKVSEIIDTYQRNAGFYTHGGITLSGGEPLVQPEFALSLFRAAHDYKDGPIHTCLDTSGGVDLENSYDKVVEVLGHTDLVLLDIKHAFPKQYKWLTGRDQEKVLAFGDLLASMNIPTLIRHVVVPDITDSQEELEGIGEIISCWPNVVGLELLAYHTMGVEKYREQAIPYRLTGVEPMDEDRLPELKHYALQRRAQCIKARRGL